MEKLRTTVAQIAATADERLPELPLLHRSLLPFLSLASHFYRFCLYLRRGLYFSALLPSRRFPVPMISVGNLTWGGNGKTPMVEFIARYFDELGIPPLILSRHWSLFRNAEVVMINGLSPWGNNHLIPRGSLREPLDALCRAHIGVIHHADLVSSAVLKNILSTVHKISPSLPIFLSRLSPMFLFEVKNPHYKLPLTMAINMVILCVSAIGFPDAFVRGVKEIGPLHVDRLDFSDHHSIKPNDINLIRKILTLLQNKFGVKAIVLVTEKDYDRDPNILREVDDFQIMVLCSSLQIMPFEDRTEEDFRMNLKKLLLSI